jgi:hypothetical protein
LSTDGETHRTRRRTLEALVGAQRSADELLRQLDREFGWRREGASPGVPPELVYWPVRLQPATLTHTVQAVVAASLSACGMEVVLPIDDLNPPLHEADALRDSLVADITRWFSLVDGSRAPSIVSLSEFHHTSAMAERMLDPRHLARPTHPWAVEREYYQVHSLFDVTRAVLPVPDNDELDAGAVTTGLAATRAERLLSPPAIWAHLHDVLLDRPEETVVTLGDDEEALMWRLWHDVFPGPIRHLFSPRVEGLLPGQLRCGSYVDLRNRLERACRDGQWRDEGRYLHWLVHNAVLLPAYLSDRPTPTVGGRRLMSWEQAVEAIGDPHLRARTIGAIAREVSTLCLTDTD